jgi:hypothetical protein
MTKGWTYDAELLFYTSKLTATSMQMRNTVLKLIHPSVLRVAGISTELSETVQQNIREGEVDKGKNYIEWIVRGQGGHMIVAYDGIRILIEVFVGTGKFAPVKVLRAALRDRQKDGKGSTVDTYSPLTSFGNADKPFNRLGAERLHIAELSIYSWNPNTMLDGIDHPGTVGHFIADPDSYIWADEFNWTQFWDLWKQAFQLNRAPWQHGMPMSTVPSFFVRQSALLAEKLGYDAVDEVPSWYNVVNFFTGMGFEFTYGEHKLVFNCLKKHLASLAPRCSLYQQAWLVALQNIPDGFVPPKLRLPVRWVCTHTNELWPRMHLNLTGRGIGVSHHQPDRNDDVIYKMLS